MDLYNTLARFQSEGKMAEEITLNCVLVCVWVDFASRAFTLSLEIVDFVRKFSGDYTPRSRTHIDRYKSNHKTHIFTEIHQLSFDSKRLIRSLGFWADFLDDSLDITYPNRTHDTTNSYLVRFYSIVINSMPSLILYDGFFLMFYHSVGFCVG